MADGSLLQIIPASMMKDVFGQALLDFHHHNFQGPLLLHNEYGPPEEIPVERYFIKEDEYSELEIFALQYLQGKILDIGSATGRHVLHLQQLGHDITALDISEACGKLMKETGVEKVIIDDIYNFDRRSYDTISMLMNGIGIVGNIDGLKQLLEHLKTILVPSGQLIIDSSDISYLYEKTKLPKDKYFGELRFHYEYKKTIDEPFDWLYIDQEKLMEVANECGWNCQIIFADETDAFLARLQYK